ncbi:small multi-drug export protein [Cytobacillus solani]|uniref:DNA-binding protein n=1 Tax=Cytobacillus solani TaxID=1637975 RepID=A0A0Q3QPZ3_9BACI|nr:small multi-drug export protein [Cytobacillus solani]KQL19672.1 DNA-binding protein [Cytobacillus solani]USK52898.1 small multi-drug export protein [Cytobacillus solani]
MIVSYFLVFLLAAIPLFELITVIPLAIIGGLAPVPVAILGFLGNLLTILLLIVFVDKIKLLLRTRKQKRNVVTEVEGGEDQYTEGTEPEQDSKKQKRARVLFDKYGLPGLTIFGPLLVGSHISAFMGMSFGSSRGLVTGWMIASLVIWTIVSTVLANSGVSFLAPDLKENGFLLRIFQ